MSETRSDVVEELRQAYAARYRDEVRETIEAGRVRDFLLAMNEPADIGALGAVPPLFILTLGRTRRPQAWRGSAVNGGDAHRFFARVHVGDTISVSRAVVDIEQKNGSRGAMYLITSELIFTNQHGVRVADSRQKTLRWDL